MELLLRKIIRRVLEEGKYLYHASPNPNIDVFEPRPFAHNEDFTESGIWVDDEPLPEGWKISNLVFAGRKSDMPFYTLPRDTPRLLIRITPKILNNIHKIIPNVTGVKKKLLVLPKSMQEDIEKHTWTEYGFDMKQFSLLPGTIDYASKNTVKPVFKKTHSNPLKYIASKGWEIIFVENMVDVYERLSNSGIEFDAEGEIN